MRTSLVAWDLEWERRGFLWGGDFERILVDECRFNTKTAGFMLARAFEESRRWELAGLIRIRFE